MLLLALVVLAATTTAKAQRPPVVHIRQGVLRGEVLTTVGFNTSYWSFKGIPFGQPPVGDLRFKDPVPAGGWEGERDASAFGSECLQMRDGRPHGAEACLFLNVFAPLFAAEDGPLPVLVFFPGGGFVRGGSDRYGPDYFMDTGDVLLVTLNYRLGAFGFLGLGIAEAPGNMGLKDQTLALLWVRDNIAAFGGDPARVLIFGQSAGGASTHAHLLSPLSADLFHSAIAISGSMVAVWAIPRNPGLQVSRLAKDAGCGEFESDAHALLECLKAMDGVALVEATNTFIFNQEEMRYRQLPFTPVMDGKVPGVKPFLPDFPENLIRKGEFHRVPFIMGFTDIEYLYFLADEPEDVSILETQFHHWMTVVEERIQAVAPDKVANVSKELIDMYASTWYHHGDKKPTIQEVVDSIVGVASDSLFVYPAVRAVFLQSQNYSAQYLYYFTLQGRLNARKARLPEFLRRVPGVTHGGDLYYMFRLADSNITLPEDTIEMKTLRTNVRMVVNFASTGNPTPRAVQGITWPPYAPSSQAYLDIGANPSIEHQLRKPEMTLWDKIQDIYGHGLDRSFLL